MTTKTVALFSEENNEHDIGQIINNVQLPNLDIQATLTHARNMLTDYCLHFGQVKGIQQADTGVIIGLIVYFIAREPSINRTKLEAYILLLNIICHQAYNKAFIDCSLTQSGRIGCFANLMNVMETNELISPRKHNTYPLCTNATELIRKLSKSFAEIEPLLRFILKTWGHFNGKQTLADALSLMGITPKDNKNSINNTDTDDGVVDAEILDKNE